MNTSGAQPVHFARRLREIRTERGLSQEALAREWGVELAWLRHLESGALDVPVATVEDVARRLGVSADVLVCGECGSGSPRNPARMSR